MSNFHGSTVKKLHSENKGAAQRTDIKNEDKSELRTQCTC